MSQRPLEIAVGQVRILCQVERLTFGSVNRRPTPDPPLSYHEAWKKIGLSRQSGFFLLMAVMTGEEIEVLPTFTTSGAQIDSAARTNAFSALGSGGVR